MPKLHELDQREANRAADEFWGKDVIASNCCGEDIYEDSDICTACGEHCEEETQ